MTLAGDLARAATWLRDADGLLVAAGAGMGIDSGLPDFRGPGGFWAVYPALGQAGIRFETIASPAAFAANPRLAWGFYGHRLDLYRQTVPHAGFSRLLGMAAGMAHGPFVFTSNVDGQFQKAGFADDRICEIHGSIHHLQCATGCGAAIWPAAGFFPQVDADACRLAGDLPRGPGCGGLARPNVLMFGDWDWIEWRTEDQQRRLAQWRAAVRHPVCVEVGAGTAIPSVRHFAEHFGGHLIRINPNEPAVPDPDSSVGLALGGLAGIAALADAVAA